MILEFPGNKLVRSLSSLCLNTSNMENFLSPNVAHLILTLLLKTYLDTKPKSAP